MSECCRNAKLHNAIQFNVSHPSVFWHKSHTLFTLAVITVTTQQISDSACLRARQLYREFVDDATELCYLLYHPWILNLSLWTNKTRNVGFFLLGDSLASEFYVPKRRHITFRSWGIIQKERIEDSQQGESLKSRTRDIIP